MSYYEKSSSNGVLCVAGTVKKIIEAQNKILEKESDCCTTSCNCSVKNLLSPGQDPNVNFNNTIPFILTCKKTCRPFLGTGVFTGLNDNDDRFFGCISTPIFKAKQFAQDSENCVELELLLPVDADGNIITPDTDNDLDVCDFFPNETINNFQATGICITVDLNSFSGITCLDPVRVLPSDNFPENLQE